MFEGFSRRCIQTSEASINMVIGGSGPPLLLLHGYPQTHLKWHKIAPRLMKDFTVVATDMRGYGDSSKPPSDSNHTPYSKRNMAQDQVEVMELLGFNRFHLAGHDRGGRVAHRLALDHPDSVDRLVLLDIIPTRLAFKAVDKNVATASFHWFFLIQPHAFPEYMIGKDPEFFLRSLMSKWSRKMSAFPEEVLSEYIRCFCQPETIHATCEDYRAGATTDLEHDETDFGRKLTCPLLVLWGADGIMTKLFNPLDVWRDYAEDVSGWAIECGHFLAEEKPEHTYQALHDFFTA
jgi:haloacetate dehalogenase